MSNTKNIEQSYQLAKERYAQVGVDTDKALKQLGRHPHFHPLLAGGRRRRLRERRPGTGRRPGRHRQLPRQSPHRRRAARRTSRRRSRVIPGSHRFNLHACYAEMSGKKVDRDALERRAVQELDRLGQGHQDRPGLQPDLLRPSQGRRRLHAHQRRHGHPQVLDRARHPLPRDRRRHRQGPRQDLRHQPLDSRRHEGHAGRPQRPARAPGRVAGRGLQEED